MTRVLALLLAGVALAGCAAVDRAAQGGRMPLPPGRVLVLARAGTPDHRAVTDAAARQLREMLRGSIAVVSADEVLREAAVAGAAWARPVLAQMQAGVWPALDDGERLARLGLAAVLTVDVTTYDQAWTRAGKATRVGIDAESFVLPFGPLAWRLHRDAQVEDERGFAFRAATDEAIEGVAAAIVPSPYLSLTHGWRFWGR